MEAALRRMVQFYRIAALVADGGCSRMPRHPQPGWMDAALAAYYYCDRIRRLFVCFSLDLAPSCRSRIPPSDQPLPEALRYRHRHRYAAQGRLPPAGALSAVQHGNPWLQQPASRGGGGKPFAERAPPGRSPTLSSRSDQSIHGICHNGVVTEQLGAAPGPVKSTAVRALPYHFARRPSTALAPLPTHGLPTATLPRGVIICSCR